MRSFRRLELTEEAEADLQSLLEYTLAAWGEEQQDRYPDRLLQAMHDLLSRPALGTARDDLKSGMRNRRVGHTSFFMGCLSTPSKSSASCTYGWTPQASFETVRDFDTVAAKGPERCSGDRPLLPAESYGFPVGGFDQHIPGGRADFRCSEYEPLHSGNVARRRSGVGGGGADAAGVGDAVWARERRADRMALGVRRVRPDVVQLRSDSGDRPAAD